VSEPREYMRFPLETTHTHEDTREYTHEDTRVLDCKRRPPLSVYSNGEAYLTPEGLLADEDIVRDLAEFFEVRDGDFFIGKKGTLLAFGPKNKTHPNGVYTLGDYYYGKQTREWKSLRKALRAVWAKRLLVELEYLTPAPIPGLDPDYLYDSRLSSGPPKARTVLEGFVLLVGVHWLSYPGQEVLFTRPFASEWCGVTMQQAYDSLRWLEARGFMRSNGMRGLQKLWLPAPEEQPVEWWLYK
jgi:hypothetical protein